MRRNKREHNRHDYNCEEYVGHNGVPREVNIYEERCVACNPYSEFEATAILAGEAWV